MPETTTHTQVHTHPCTHTPSEHLETARDLPDSSLPASACFLQQRTSVFPTRSSSGRCAARTVCAHGGHRPHHAQQPVEPPPQSRGALSLVKHSVHATSDTDSVHTPEDRGQDATELTTTSPSMGHGSRDRCCDSAGIRGPERSSHLSEVIQLGFEPKPSDPPRACSLRQLPPWPGTTAEDQL